jgi:predicted nuclease of predicted toxin-antitoxin system
MEIKLDENPPACLAERLEALGHDVATPADEGLSGAPDSDIWQAAQTEQRFLITQDLDFSDRRRFVPGTHHGILLVRLHAPSRRSLIQRIQSVFRQEDLTGWLGCFVVVTDHKIRLRRP